MVGQRGQHLRIVLDPVRVHHIQILMLYRVHVQLEPLDEPPEVEVILAHFLAHSVLGHLDYSLLSESQVQSAH